LNRIIYFILILVFSVGCKRNRPSHKIDGEPTIRESIVVNSDNKVIKENVPSISNILSVKVIRILDGDTIEILYDQLSIKLRLAHIDAPEKRGKQAFGNNAKKALSDLCYGQMVKVHSDGEFDRNGRLIGVIYNNQGLNLNKEMVRLGMAWHYKKYSDDQSYDSIEREARAAKTGLWQDPSPIAPWDYR